MKNFHSRVCTGSTLDLVLSICHIKARPGKTRDVTISSVVKLKAKCCKLPTSDHVLQYSVLCIFTNRRIVAIKQSKIPMSRARKQQL